MQALEYVQNNIRALQYCEKLTIFVNYKKTFLPVIPFKVKNISYIFRSLYSTLSFFMCHEKIFSFMQIFKF